ncbi:MAG TPA: hypothetical protein VLZ81_04580 [Blastocatellia bacterium]|nr:hypothetical protein [Blastocatellia bacterium]
MIRRIPRAPMEPYVPASALAFVQVDSLGKLIDGLTSTKAWRELAPLLGVSSQLRQVGQAATIMGNLGLGPNEAVIAGRAQYVLILTGLEAESGSTDEGPYLHLKPHLVLVIKTHSTPEAAQALVRDRAQILARRIYGDSATARSDQYFESQIQIFDGPGPGHQLVAASASDLVLIANDAASVKVCLDAIDARTPNMASDSTLMGSRAQVDDNASVFGFVTAAGIEKISGLAPALLTAQFTNNPDQAADIANLVQHVTSQAVSGLLYSAELTPDGVTDRYLTVLKQSMSSDLADLMKPPAGPDLDQTRMVPPSVEGFTVVNVRNVGGLPERALKSIGPKFDLVGSLALKELVIGLRKEMGLEGSQSIETALGDDLVLVRFGDAEPEAVILSVRDRAALAPYIDRYLGKDGASTSRDDYGGVEIAASSNPDGRAAAFVDSWLVLGTRQQIAAIIDHRKGTGESGQPLWGRGATAPPSASIISCAVANRQAGEAMLAVSRITRTSDGSPELLEKESVRSALRNLPPSISFTRFQDNGIYTETKSTAGNFGLLASLGSKD